MIEKIKRMVFHICGLLLVMILVMFTLSSENASAEPVYLDTYNQDAGQEEVSLAANREQQPEQQAEQKDEKPKEMKNDTGSHSMMGSGDAGKNWMWTFMIIVLMVLMMV